MKPIDLQFGRIIAFLLPGFIFLYGARSFFPDVQAALSAASEAKTSIGTFLFVVLAALAAGLMLSAGRWLIVDTLICKIGIKRWQITVPTMSYSKLADPNTYAAFTGVVDNHYNFYQYFANSLIAVVAVFVIACAQQGAPSYATDIGFVVVCMALLLAARDALKKYYVRASEILK
ncbi:MAG: hypothetical protein WA446_02780 [Steroidobacteraceae bacterium]